jgi:hypothetical protein
MYNHNVIKYKITWSPDLQADLDNVYAQDDADGLFIDELFELLETNEGVLECLSLGKFQRISDPRFDAAPIQWALKDGYNIYYLKAWRRDGALVPWRVIYAIHHGALTTIVRILGLMERSDEYKPNSDFGRRVHADYDGNGIPRVPRC